MNLLNFPNLIKNTLFKFPPTCKTNLHGYIFLPISIFPPKIYSQNGETDLLEVPAQP